jgi:hypothetical protein
MLTLVPQKSEHMIRVSQDIKDKIRALSAEKDIDMSRINNRVFGWFFSQSSEAQSAILGHLPGKTAIIEVRPHK